MLLATTTSTPLLFPLLLQLTYSTQQLAPSLSTNCRSFYPTLRATIVFNIVEHFRMVLSSSVTISSYIFIPFEYYHTGWNHFGKPAVYIFDCDHKRSVKMNSLAGRANTIVSFGLSTLAFVTFLCALTTQFESPQPTVSINIHDVFV